MGRSKQSSGSKGKKNKSPSKATTKKNEDVKSQIEEAETKTNTSSKSSWMMLGIFAILAGILAAAIPHLSGLNLAGISTTTSSPESPAARNLAQETAAPVSTESKAEEVVIEEEKDSQTVPIEPPEKKTQEEEPKEVVAEEEESKEAGVEEESTPEDDPIVEEAAAMETEEETVGGDDEGDDDGDDGDDSDKEDIDTRTLLIRDAGTYEFALPTMDPNVNRTVTMKSVSSRPRVFVIEDYLTDEECDLIIEKADASMEPSRTERPRGRPSLHDVNQDGFIDLAEMRITIGVLTDIHLTDEELLDYYATVDGLDLGEDALITREHMQYLNPMGMAEYAKQIAEEKPMRRGRYADHAWLKVQEDDDDENGKNKYNDVIRMLEKRVGIVLGMQEELVIQSGESQLQVVQYHSHGHYNTHYDSSDRPDESMRPPEAHQLWGMCCHVTRRLHVDGKNLPNCRSCRFATLLYYLQTPDTGGGETVFPFVDQEEFNELAWRVSPEGDPSHYCSADKSDNLLVAPKRGRAVVFFNHLPSEELGLAYGKVDRSSMHASCPIHEGNTVPKIMANHWIEISDRLSDEDIRPGDDLPT